MDRASHSRIRFNPTLALATLGLATLLLAPCPATAEMPPTAASFGWRYVSPVPGAERVTPETNVILRPGAPLDPASVSEDGAAFALIGSVSGAHPGRARLADDGRTVTFRPFTPFTPGETVTCAIGPGLRTDAGDDVPAGTFAFTVAGPEQAALRSAPVPADAEDDPFGTIPALDAPAIPDLAAAIGSMSTDSLPPDFPAVTASVLGRPSPGRIFLADIRFLQPTHPSTLMIVENDGTPVWYRKLNGMALDFKMLPDGRLSYFDRSRGKFYAMDSTFADVDSFACGNGYITDSHDLLLLPDGHAILMAYDPELVDMSAIVPKGQPTAEVVGLILQEIDREKNVVWEWRSWDHFQITDMQNHPLNSTFIDYVHGNSICLDLDGNLVLSSRHMNEVTKIDRTTGELIWRLGGKNNQFTFVNDPIGFSHQHDARILPDGHLTLFDNGNFHVPPFSRAAEYELDTRKMTATLVWQYRHDPDVFGVATGSVQRLPTGNTLIGWGVTTPTLTAVTPDGTVIAEMSYAPGTSSYRAYRFDWPRPLPASVTVLPHTINLGAGGTTIAASIEPDGWSLDEVVPGSIRLSDTVPADSEAITVGDLNGNGVPDLDVRFDRSATAALLTTSTTWLDVSGTLRDGRRFRGYDIVRVAEPVGPRGGTGGATPSLVSTPGVLPARIALSGFGDAAAVAGGATRTLAVFDVRGRLVRRWRATVAPGGVVTWDGRAADGRRVASGIYFLRADGAAPSAAAKVVVAR
ncbi:MAG: aryl-sulfate sulfotransferase [Hyphomicrobiales bacterium]